MFGGGGEEFAEGGLGNFMATIRPYEQFKHEGGLEEAEKLGWWMRTELEQDP